MKNQFRRWALNRLRSILTVLSLAAGMAVAIMTTPAQAAEGNIRPPFAIGESWSICRGYGYASHTGTSTYGLDLTGSGCDNSASGRSVVAPIGGTVAYYQAAYGNLCINKPGGGSYTLTHINSSVASGTVAAGQTVGTVAAPNSRGNAGVSHIHFQMWTSSGCYGDAGVPFDSAHGARICGAPDLTPSGPNGFNNGTWSGTSFVGQSCGGESAPTSVAPVISVQVEPNGTQHVYSATKSGKIYETWWGPNDSGTTYLLANLSVPVTAIDSQITPDGTQHVFTSTQNGVYETWWNANSGGVQTNTLQNVGGVKAITSYYGADGVMHVFSGDSSGVMRETWWGAGTNGTLPIGNLGTAITAISHQLTPWDNTHHVYVSASPGVYETWWNAGSSGPHTGFLLGWSGVTTIASYVSTDKIQHVISGSTYSTANETWWGAGTNGIHGGQLANLGSPVRSIAVRQTATDGATHVYSVTTSGLHETWWNATSNGPHSGLLASLSDPVAVDSWVTADGIQHVYTAANDGGLRETWWGPGTNGIHTGFLASVS